MPTYTLETPRGKRLTIEAQNDRDAMDLADRWDLQDHAVTEAQRLGVRPDLILKQMDVESGTKASAKSPKGALGPMQLMPGTAKDLGVDPTDPYQNITGGVTYLKRQLDAFGGDERKALAAYNAGPGAVQRAGGVPNYPETQKYVGALAGQGSPQAAPGLPAPIPQRPQQGLGADAAHPIVLTTANRDQIPEGAFFRTSLGEVRQQKKGSGYTPDAPKVPQRAAPMDSLLGLFSGAEKGLAGVTDTMLSAFPIVGPTLAAANRAKTGSGPIISMTPPMLSIMAKVAAANGYKPQTDAGKVSETVGTMLPNAAAPGTVGGRILNVLLPAFGQEAGERTVKALGGDENAQRIAGMVGAGAGGLATGLRMGPAPAKLPRADLDAMKIANRAAWKAVDESGYRFPQRDVKATADAISGLVNEAGPELYSEAAKVAKQVQSLAARGNLTPAQANRLRSQVSEKLMSPGSTEVSVGKEILGHLNALIDSGDVPTLVAAREGYKRIKKLDELTARINDAELARESAGTGGNGNALRQQFKPLVKQKGNQQLKGATADEKAAIRQIATGTPVQNALRLATAFDPTAGKLQALLYGALGTATLGKTLALAPIGFAARKGEQAIESANVQKLLDLVAAGGVKPKAPGVTYSGGAQYAGLPAVIAPLLAGSATAKPRQPSKARQSR